MLTSFFNFNSTRLGLKKIWLLLCLCFFISSLGHAQDTTGYADIDRQAMMLTTKQAPDFNSLIQWFRTNFTTGDSRVRAVYTFIASHFAYDVPNMYNWDVKETKQQKIAHFLRTGKGICEHYAYTFDSICRQLGMRSYMIGGITRQQGKNDSLPHAWNAVEVDGQWYLFDPTWGAGYVQDGRYVPHLNYAYYKVNPEAFILSHMPFDPLWQCLEMPFTQEQFTLGKLETPAIQTAFLYRDSLLAYEKQNAYQQAQGTLRRILAQGNISEQTEKYVSNLRLQIHQYEQNELAGRYNLAVADYNQAIVYFNRFIAFKNRQFKPTKTDSALLVMVKKPLEQMHAASGRLLEIEGADSTLKKAIQVLQQKIVVLAKRQQSELEFVNRYLVQNSAGRQAMFLVKTIRRVPAKRSTH